MPTNRLSPIDLAIVAVYLVAITVFGLRFAKRGKQSSSLKGYFLADNTIPWWAIALSIVSAETSTLTIVSIPGVAFAGDMGFLQIVLGYMLGRIVVAMLFLPKYFRGEMLTAYQLIDRRFGPVLHKVTAGLFLLTRAAAEGVRVFAISIVVSVAIGTGDTLSIAIISALTLLYTFEGGMAAVIWTDVVQMALYVAGTLVALYTLGAHVPGGWTQIHAVAAPLHKFHVFNFALNLTQSYTFWAGILGGTFLTMASHGTDQLMVQRMLAARNLRESRLALLSSGAVILLQFTLFLLIGIGLFVFYGQHPPTFRSNDYIFPTFIVQQMPRGVAGLLIAAILAAAMSNLSAALNSLASTTVIDFYVPIRALLNKKKSVILSGASRGSIREAQSKDPESENTAAHGTQATTLVSRTSTVVWAIVLFAIAVYSIKAGGKGHVVETGLSIASVAYGCLLGVFLLGTLTRYATQWGASAGMICGFALNLYLWQGKFPVQIGSLMIPHIAFTWYVLIGSLATFVLGSFFSVILPKPRRAVATAILLLMASLTPFAQPQNPVPHLRDSFIVAKVGIGGADPSTALARDESVPPGLKPAHVLASCPTAEAVGLSTAWTASANTGETRVSLTTKAEGISETSSNSTPEAAVLGNASDPDFTPVSTLINTAIAEHKLPGAVVLIGRNGKVVFEQAYGLRKLAGEPDLDGKPSPAEAMTEDTIFDMASLTKLIVTTTAILQLYDQHKLDPVLGFDAPVAKYLPEFAQNGKDKITIRQLLTHYSGLPEDVNLKDDWGLKNPDKLEGIKRAMASVPYGPPGLTFRYSDINFITLGALVERVSGLGLENYAETKIFFPLGYTETWFRSTYDCFQFGLAYGHGLTHNPPRGVLCDLLDGAILDIAPTAHDNEGTAASNPNFDHLLRGTVHDPTTRRMGGVAGHAGVFSTAHDMSLFAQALLDKLLHNTGPFPVSQATLQLATSPQAPATAVATANIFTQDQQPAKGVAQRGLGWDINSAFSRPRGEIFPIATGGYGKPGHPGSFGHTGFTGTSLWIDPTTDTYVILLANAIHPRGAPAISPLRGAVATAAAKALGLATTASVPHLRDSLIVAKVGIGEADQLTSVPAIQLASFDPNHPCAPPVLCDTFGAPTPHNPVILSEASRGLMREAQSKDPEAAKFATTDRPTQLVASPLLVSASRYPKASALGLSIDIENDGLQPLGYALSRQVSTSSAARKPLHDYQPVDCDGKPDGPIITEKQQQDAEEICSHGVICDTVQVCSSAEEISLNIRTSSALLQASAEANRTQDEKKQELKSSYKQWIEQACCGIISDEDLAAFQHSQTQTGIDVLESTNFAALKTIAARHNNHLRIGLLTNQSGIDAQSRRTIDILAHAPPEIQLVTLFTPEHGLLAKQDTEHPTAETDPATHLPILSLYGPKAADKHPKQADLKKLDAVVIDLQDAGVRFWTYETVMAYFLEDCARAHVEVIVLDRPNPIGGVGPQGPISDPGFESYINYMSSPVRHGMTFGELARFFNANAILSKYKPELLNAEATNIGTGAAESATGTPLQIPATQPGLHAQLTVIPMQNWRRTEYFADTGLPWIPPSPNMKTPATNIVYPGVALMEMTNMSVGRGTPAPYENFGAPFLKSEELASYLTARRIPGVTFSASTMTVAETPEKYPFHGQTIPAIHLTVTDRNALDSPAMGVELLAALYHFYPADFQLEKARTTVVNADTLAAIKAGKDPVDIAATWGPGLRAYKELRAQALLYP